MLLMPVHISKTGFLKTILPAILSLLLSGCFFYDEPAVQPVETGEVHTDGPYPTDVPTRNPPTPGQFTIRYDPGNAINPITSLSMDNIVLSSLLYEALFTLDGSLNVEPVLCES